jgi:hypothetical protein
VKYNYYNIFFDSDAGLLMELMTVLSTNFYVYLSNYKLILVVLATKPKRDIYIGLSLPES